MPDCAISPARIVEILSDALPTALRGSVESVHVIDGRLLGVLLLQMFTPEGLGTLIRAEHGSLFVEDSLSYLEEVAP